MNNLILDLLPGRFAICQMSPDSVVNFSATLASGELRSLTWTTEEVSILCPEEEAPLAARAEPGWRAFRVRGPLDFSLVGVLAALTGALAAAGIPVFVLSTFNTDYVLVQGEHCEAACLVLAEAGHVVQKNV
jgi:uncharacterized protein